MIFQEERDANYVDPMDIMHNYPFQFTDDKGNKEYLTHEYIRMNWSKERLFEFLTSLDEKELKKFKETEKTWAFRARKSQRFPSSDYENIIAICGRGWGKTMFGANWIIQKAKHCKLLAIAGATEKDVINVMLSAIIKNCPDDFKPVLNKTDRRLTFPNGCIVEFYSSESEHGPRGGNLEGAWVDELVKFKKTEEFLSNLELACREGETIPQILYTSTPQAANVVCSRYMRDLIKDGAFVINGATKDNYHLNPKKVASYYKKWGGTKKGLEELEGKLSFDDDVGATFSQSIIDRNKVEKLPEGVFFKRKIIAIDPSVSNNVNSDECGMVVMGLASDDNVYIIEDLSKKMSVAEWATLAIKAFKDYKCELICVEINNGGDLVEDAITVRSKQVEVKQFRARFDKKSRAAPVGDLYEQNRVKHIGTFVKLEDQMVTFDPAISTKKSPDRMDALVWGVHELIIEQEDDIDDYINAYVVHNTDNKIEMAKRFVKVQKDAINSEEDFFDELIKGYKNIYGIDDDDDEDIFNIKF